MNGSKSSDLDSYVRQQLDRYFPKTGSASLIEVCDQVEDVLVGLVETTTLDQIRALSIEADVRFVTGPSPSFVYDNMIYEIRTLEHPTHFNSLRIVIRSTGKYVEVRVTTDRAFLACQSLIAEAAVLVLESGYRWLTEYVRATLNGLRTETTEALYSYLRQLFPAKIVDDIWLYAIVEQHGIYVPDSLAFQAAIERVSQRRIATSQSPVRLATDFSTRLIEFDKVFSKIAISQDSTVVGRMVEAPYAGSGIELAEEAIYQSKEFVIQPLVREGKVLLSAAYPTPIRSLVEPVLKKEREQFRQIIKLRASSYYGMIQRLRDQRFLLGVDPKLFEVFGAFLRGLLDISS